MTAPSLADLEAVAREHRHRDIHGCRQFADMVIAYVEAQAADLTRLDRRLLADAEAKAIRDRVYIEGLRTKINDAAGIT